MIEERIPGKNGEGSGIGGSEGKGNQAARLHHRAGHQAGRQAGGLQLTALADPDVWCRADRNCPRTPSITGSETMKGIGRRCLSMKGHCGGCWEWYPEGTAGHLKHCDPLSSA